ncbi:MAG: putative toxin-antitoxin system toxin component, PIN family [Leptolyngbyaceae cyanobacterium]
MRIVLDTNIWISALLFGGTPSKLIRLAQMGQVQIYSSESLLAELAEVLNYPKFQLRLQRLKTTSEALMVSATRLITLCRGIVPYFPDV